MSQRQRAERQLTGKQKWSIWLNQWKPSSWKKMWHEEHGKIEMKKAKVTVQLDSILSGKR